MIKFFITTLLAGTSFMMMHAGDDGPQSPFTISKDTPLASRWKIPSTKQKTDKPHLLPSVKEGAGNGSDENLIECTEKYTPSAGARTLFEQFLLKSMISADQKIKLATIFRAKPIKLEKQQRESHPQEYYESLATCREQNFMYTFLEFAHQKSEADYKEHFSTFQQEKLAQQQRHKEECTALEKIATRQEEMIRSLNQRLEEQQQSKQRLEVSHQAHLTTTEKRMQDIQKINLALVGVTGVSIAALAFVATHALSTAKTVSSPAATTAS